MNVPDHYDVLGISPEADSAAIDQAYWRRVRQHRGLGAVNPEALDQLNQAYEVLATPRLRRQYDECRQLQAGPDAGRASEVGERTWVSKLWPQGGLMRFVEGPGVEPELQPSDLLSAAGGPDDNHRPAAAGVLGEADQLRSSTASLVERWRTSRAEIKGWAILSDR